MSSKSVKPNQSKSAAQNKKINETKYLDFLSTFILYSKVKSRSQNWGEKWFCFQHEKGAVCFFFPQSLALQSRFALNTPSCSSSCSTGVIGVHPQTSVFSPFPIHEIFHWSVSSLQTAMLVFIIHMLAAARSPLLQNPKRCSSISSPRGYSDHGLYNKSESWNLEDSSDSKFFRQFLKFLVLSTFSRATLGVASLPITRTSWQNNTNKNLWKRHFSENKIHCVVQALHIVSVLRWLTFKTMLEGCLPLEANSLCDILMKLYLVILSPRLPTSLWKQGPSPVEEGLLWCKCQDHAGNDF